MSILQAALADTGVSVEDFQAIPVEATIEEPLLPIDAVSVDQPSVSIPVVETVITETPGDVVAGVPIMELTATTEPAIDNVNAEHAAIQDKTDQLIALQTAMERYEGLIRRAGFNGISNQTAEAIQVHIQLSQAVLGVSTKIGSMESFTAKGPEQQHELATVTLESIREMAQSAGNSFIAAIEKILEFIKRLGMNLFDGIIQTERAIDQLDRELKASKVLGVESDTYTVQGSAGILVGEDGKLVKGVPPNVAMLVQFTVVDYPQRVSKFFDEAAKILSAASKDADDYSEILERLDSATQPLADMIEHKSDTDDLPGHYSLDVTDGGLSFGLKHNEANTTYDKTERIGTTKELRDQVRQMKAVVEVLRKIRPEAEKISTSGKKLLAAAKANGNEELLNKAATYIHQANPRVGEVIDYVVKFLKAQCVEIKAQMTAVSKPTAKE